MNERKLGRGLSDLLAVREEAPRERTEGELMNLATDAITPGTRQPRKAFDSEELAELADSIAQNGILQPVVVRKTGDRYELIAGERRWRAAKQIGLSTIPAIIRGADEQRALELSLIENIQRQDLNPIEKAKAFKQLIDGSGLTQEEVGQRLGKKRSSIANMIRLLELPEDIQDIVSRGTISMGHARALLAVSDPQEQRRLCRRIVAEDLSVRQVEKLASQRQERAGVPRPQPVKPANVKSLEEQLRRALGTRVTIIQGRKGRGRILVDFFSVEEFERLYERLTAGG